MRKENHMLIDVAVLGESFKFTVYVKRIKHHSLNREMFGTD
jgi:hypothetical protein